MTSLRSAWFGSAGMIAVTMLLLAPRPGVAQPAPAKPALQFVIPGLPTPQPGGAAQPNIMQQGTTRQAGATGKWWDQLDMIKALDLTDEQRTKMDQALTATLEKEAAMQRKQIEARQQFEVTLKAGDWEGAKKAATEWDTTLAGLYGTQNTLKIEVLSLLSAPQRSKLAANYDYLFRRPWIGGPIVGEFHMQGSHQLPQTPAPGAAAQPEGK